MKTNRLRNIIKRTLNEKKQLLKESCTCYTQNPVSGGPALVYYTCAGQSGNATVAASCSCCCNAWLHPDDVADDNCLTTSVAPPSGGGDDGLGLYADEFVTVDDSGTSSGDILDMERYLQKGDLIPKGGRRRALRESYFPRGEFSVSGVYKDVKPFYNFQSVGPNPGKSRGPGYDFESKGPLGVNYFAEEEGEGPNPWAICTSSLGLEGKKRKDYTDSQKNKYEKCVLGIKKKIKEGHIKRVINKVLYEQENIAATLYKQDTSHRDAETGQVIASTEMLDIMNTKLDTLTDIVNDLYDNLSRDWT